MRATIFREYDIRGRVDTEFIIDEVYNLGRAIATYFLQKNSQVKTVVFGMDGRIHSPLIKDHLIQGFIDSGLDAIFIGVVPTPVLYFALYTLPVDAGIMITASHNPPEYNGIKLCLGKHSVWGLQVKEIQALYQTKAYHSSATLGALRDYAIIDDYIEWLASHFNHLKGIQLPIVFDCGNGTAGLIMRRLLDKLQWGTYTILYEDLDGTMPNHEADPVKEHNMQDIKKILAATSLELGIGFDGDADRMAAMTKTGFLVPGDQLLALFSKALLQDHPHAGIVMDIKSSSGLLELLEQWGAHAYLSPSGHAIIKDQMRKHKALIGGELSCHFFFNDRYFGYDDGIYAALRLCELLVKTKQSLHELLTLFPKKWSTPEYRIPCQEHEKQQIVEHVKEYFAQRNDVSMITIDGVRAQAPYGWGIVRASNTQAELCLRFESDSCQGLRQVMHDFVAVLQPYVATNLSQLIIEGH